MYVCLRQGKSSKVYLSEFLPVILRTYPHRTNLMLEVYVNMSKSVNITRSGGQPKFHEKNPTAAMKKPYMELSGFISAHFCQQKIHGEIKVAERMAAMSF